jgi:hypothetical protein
MLRTNTSKAKVFIFACVHVYVQEYCRNRKTHGPTWYICHSPAPTKSGKLPTLCLQAEFVHLQRTTIVGLFYEHVWAMQGPLMLVCSQSNLASIIRTKWPKSTQCSSYDHQIPNSLNVNRKPHTVLRSRIEHQPLCSRPMHSDMGNTNSTIIKLLLSRNSLQNNGFFLAAYLTNSKNEQRLVFHKSPQECCVRQGDTHWSNQQK